MSTINSVNTLSGSTQTSAASKKSSSSDLFMTLLSAQLKNQSPLEASSSSDLTNQLAQLQQGSALNSIESLLTQLLDSQGTQNLAESSLLIGKEAFSTLDSTQSLKVSGTSAVSFEWSATTGSTLVQMDQNTGSVLNSWDLTEKGSLKNVSAQGDVVYKITGQSASLEFGFQVSSAQQSGATVILADELGGISIDAVSVNKITNGD